MSSQDPSTDVVTTANSTSSPTPADTPMMPSRSETIEADQQDQDLTRQHSQEASNDDDASNGPSQLNRQVSNALSEKSQSDDPFLVSFGYKDSRDPRQWSTKKKVSVLCGYLVSNLWAQVISSAFAPASNAAAMDVGVSEAAMRTVQAIYLYGVAVGPIVVAPVSEDYGRRFVLVLSVGIIALCQIPCALAGSIALMLPFRFIAGFFAASTFNVVGNVADLWDTPQQAWGVNAFAIAVEVGAYGGTIIGGYIYQFHGWEWTFGVAGIVMGAITVLSAFVCAETRGGIILSRIAAQKRKETGDDRYYCLHEREVSAKTWQSRITETLGRPIWMLLSEPIVLATSIFDGLNYMIIYGFILSFELVYGKSYGWSVGNSNLPFLAVIVGALLGFAAMPIQRAYERRAAAKAVDGEPEPEVRLYWLLTAPLFPISLFWFAWTAVPNIHWISSVLSTVMFGFVSHIIFVAVSDYTASCYSMYAASAIGAQSLFREILCGSFTLFTIQMYEGLGYSWASTLLAILAAVVSILPFLLYYYGPKLRARSPFCQEQIKNAQERRKAAERMEKKQNRQTDQKGSEPEARDSAHARQGA
ncbi:unnamed protein product [Sympodiomycopsis kandeliae]